MWNVLNSTRERLNYAQKPIFDATTFHFSQNLQPQKLHSAWYKGDIVTLRCRGYIATISADWDVEYIDLNDYFACDADLKKNCVATCDFRKHLVSKISLNCTFSTPKGLAKTIALKSKWLNNAIIEVFQDIFPDEDKMKEDIYNTISKYMEIDKCKFELSITRKNIYIRYTGEK